MKRKYYFEINQISGKGSPTEKWLLAYDLLKILQRMKVIDFHMQWDILEFK